MEGIFYEIIRRNGRKSSERRERRERRSENKIERWKKR